MIDFKEHVEKAKQGDHSSFSILYQELYTPVFKYTISRTRHRETAEDIVSEVFIKFYTSLDRYELSGDTPLSYLYTIAKNTIINHGKKKKADLFEDDEEFAIADNSKSHLEKSIDREDFELIMAHLEQLGGVEQEVVRLKFLSELTTKEVADILGKTEVNIRQLESRALKKIRESINQTTL